MLQKVATLRTKHPAATFSFISASEEGEHCANHPAIHVYSENISKGKRAFKNVCAMVKPVCLKVSEEKYSTEGDFKETFVTDYGVVV